VPRLREANTQGCNDRRSLLTPRTKVKTANIAAEGSHNHSASLLTTANPLAEKNRPTPMGDTLIGWKGKKKRAFVKGEKNATPKPPFVIASRMPWDAVAKNKYKRRRQGET